MAAPAATLEHTPTWALATVCFVFISISIALEHSIHLLTNWLKRRRKHALCGAVEKLKSELMHLGFMSILLGVIDQSPISNICVPAKMGDFMLPCRKQLHLNMASSASHPCTSQGKVTLITKKGIQQLHRFIFVLAVMQIIYSVLTLALGRAKMRRWKAWEEETQTTEYQVANDPERFRLTRQTTFGRRHVSSCTETSVQLWTKCFFRQFFSSVAKVDYLTLRHGFIMAHLSMRCNNFNFQKYIERSLDEDFKTVVSISPLMWILVVVFILVDVYGWHAYFWVSFIPLLVVLLLGTKLEVIVARMALQINSQNTVIKGIPLVQPNDKLFWFRRPRFVLTLIHFTLFWNAFELAFCIWVTIIFGFDSCYHEHTAKVVTRIILAITVQVLCSYITLPLYALVTQMGSEFRRKVLDDQMAQIVKQWHAGVRERRRKQELLLQSPRASLHQSSPTLTESIHLSNRGEIKEEHNKVVKVEAGLSGGPSEPVVSGHTTRKANA